MDTLRGFPFPVFVSSGGAERGRSVAVRAAQAAEWLDRTVGMPEIPPLYVVNANDWDAVATTPQYGMPHVDSDRIVVGQEPAAFWSTLTGVIAPLVGPEGLARLRQVYGDDLDLGGFADLLVCHELSHLAHGASWPAGPVGFWLKELAANLGLQGYVAEVEPEQSATLETIFEVTWAAPSDPWPVHDLARMNESLVGDGSNYVWFEFGLHVLAKRLWDTAGATALRTLVAALQGPPLDLTHVVNMLADLDPSVARTIQNWPNQK
ncbi:hypothetical protein E0H73_30680 [Kribbella pittospori]|uniref:DUF2268 domain-containing protein n=1 Tax=Kribbella pittospori TaxID=722689 RepID=A0A4R0KPA4_9ACTN|nr:hypothetical protein [Kribbella pittospori]TCC57725.1 hypothetical protein E0H73_30680 [Kribbella pittospori]